MKYIVSVVQSSKEFVIAQKQTEIQHIEFGRKSKHTKQVPSCAGNKFKLSLFSVALALIYQL